MNKLVLIIALLAMNFKALAQTDPVVIEVNNKQIRKSDFLQIYLKNNPKPKYDKQSIDEYLELYKKFKFKVSEAELLGYDTIPKLKKELLGYRKTLSTPYLVDKQENTKLIEEAYKRLSSEIRASHILIKVDINASPIDTLKAYNKILAIKNKIEKGEDFNLIAKQNSEDPSAEINNGDLGYFTAFQMVFPFEEAAYNTPIGKISNIVRTRFGYHILKITDLRPARGIMKASHIMISLKKDASEEEIKAALRKIDEIYDKIIKGENFEELAQNFSDDPGSADKGGKLPEFGSGATTRMVTEFEDAAFALKNNGDFSKPIRTDYGYHIIKRINVSPLGTFDSMKKELQNKVNKDDRVKKTQTVLIEKLKVEYKYTEIDLKRLKWFIKNIDTTYYYGKWNANKLNTDKTIFTLNNIAFTEKTFAEYLTSNFRDINKTSNKNLIYKQFNNWVNSVVINYEDTHLEQKYPEFKSLMQEYHDGVLLYEIMTDKVWNKASRDTLGLKEFYEKNKQNYRWKDRIDATIYECMDKSIAEKVVKLIKNDTINSKHVIDKINATSELNVKVKMNKFEIQETPYLKDKKLKKGINPLYEFNGKYYVIKVTEIIPSSTKLLTEAKGLITSDYQNYLEKIWLDELNKKYTFKVNESIIYSLDK
ncbi:MAG: peptidylprolyl isomerase [Crocinitomicaceae bacterium]|nr:peptidylprolyl isomerase [Crocinitomicaceae bacterium]